MVDLFVSEKKYDHSKMFGTELSTNLRGKYKDACSGDSGLGEVYIYSIYKSIFVSYSKSDN